MHQLLRCRAYKQTFSLFTSNCTRREMASFRPSHPALHARRCKLPPRMTSACVNTARVYEWFSSSFITVMLMKAAVIVFVASDKTDRRRSVRRRRATVTSTKRRVSTERASHATTSATATMTVSTAQTKPTAVGRAIMRQLVIVSCTDVFHCRT